ncbi:hypothetical protein [Anaerostipes faecis]|uniref:hypothetical protein n=1 Tax=Anaerostipes faecis TaxID=2880702 RepID=UPI00265A21A0|nr:hypothetical protein [Anaerostipes faecis]
MIMTILLIAQILMDLFFMYCILELGSFLNDLFELLNAMAKHMDVMDRKDRGGKRGKS